MTEAGCTVHVYSRQDCGLCDEVLAHLAALGNRYTFHVSTIDIDADASLQARYGEQIPVVHVNGRAIGWGRIPPALLEQHIARAAGGP